MKDDKIALLVNTLTNTAKEFHDHQSLRERMSKIVKKALDDERSTVMNEVKKMVNYKVGIIGYGYVGKAVHASLQPIQNNNVSIYDKDKVGFHNMNKLINQKDFVFVCVNTPKNDYSDFENVMRTLVDFGYNGIVVVKSTVPFTEMCKYINNLKIIFNPEFLNQNTYIEDAENQDYIVLGGEYLYTNALEDLYRETNLSKNDLTFKHTSIENAINFKYIRNIYGAYKVLFWEFVQDTTDNARLMAEMLEHVPQGEMSQVGLDGERGYGGACFPKDTVNFNAEKEHDLTKNMIALNKYYNSN